jgi:hypothetical protein
LVVGLALVSGAAFALWSSSGTGSGTARALTATSVTVTAAAGAADLYPGFASGNVYFTLNNTNPYAITFTSMAAGTVVSSNPAACPATNVTVGGASGLSLAVAAGATSVTQSINGVVSMVAAAPDGCQGIVFTVSLTLTGTQS